MKKAKGFTLIELMICIAIVGILSVVGVQAYNDYNADTSNDSSSTHTIDKNG